MANWRKALKKGVVVYFDENEVRWISNAPVSIVQVEIGDKIVLDRVKGTAKKLERVLEALEAELSGTDDEIDDLFEPNDEE